MTEPPAVAVLDRTAYRRGGQAVLLVRTDPPVVIKRYGARKDPLRQALVQLGHWTFAGKSSASAAGRRATEAECLALWRRHGFDVFRVLPGPPPLPIAGPHLILEYVPGRTLYDLLADGAVPEAEKEALLERFGATWGRRHALALRFREPRLLHEHGTFRHVWVGQGRLITFDLEIAWVRAGRLPWLVAAEVAAFLRSLGRASGRAFRRRLAALVAAYPERELLKGAAQVRLRDRFRRRADPFGPRPVLEALRETLGVV